MQQNESSLRYTVILVAILILVLNSVSSAQSETRPAAPVRSAPSEPLQESEIDTIKIEELRIGLGDELVRGCWATIHYKGMLPDGQVFYETYGGAPFEFFYSELLMEGWVQGLAGLRVGGKRRVTIPSQFGYRSTPPSQKNSTLIPIPVNSPVIFEFECLRAKFLPVVKLSNKVEIQRLREGQGEPAGYGDWITFHVKVFAGADSREGLNTYHPENGPFQVALPTPSGIFTGNTTRMQANLPYLDMLLYGLKAGERREVVFNDSRFLGPVGDPLLGVKPNEPFAIEIDCVDILRGPTATLNNGLTIQDINTGTGRYAHLNAIVFIRYKGTLEDGTVIESNWDDPEPLRIRLFRTTIIAGMRIGIQGMRVGGVRMLYVPANLAFGEVPPDKYAHVPPNSPVIYQVELVDTWIPR